VHFVGFSITALADINRLLIGVLYWWVWTVLVPRWRGYHLEEDVEILEDGTSITRLVHKVE
jgi:hypothetical protein